MMTILSMLDGNVPHRICLTNCCCRGLGDDDPPAPTAASTITAAFVEGSAVPAAADNAAVAGVHAEDWGDFEDFESTPSTVDQPAAAVVASVTASSAIAALAHVCYMSSCY